MFGVSPAFMVCLKLISELSHGIYYGVCTRNFQSWICAGDFNELLKSHEKLGSRLRPYGQMEKFREVLDEWGLLDLGFSGNKFTWSKSYPNGGIVWERLGR